MLNTGITDNKFFDKCVECHDTLKSFNDCFKDLIEYLHGSVDTGIVPHKDIMPLIEHIECFQMNSDNLCNLLCQCIRQRIEYIGNSYQLKSAIVIADQIHSVLSEQISLFIKKLEYIEPVLIDCEKVIDRWCKQKWLGKESIFQINKYVKFIPSVMIDLLCYSKEYMDKLNTHKMSIVYASPEIMTDKLPDTSQTQIYPYIHSISDEDSEDDPYFRELYGAPRMMDHPNEHKNESTQNNERKTVFCIYCGKIMTNHSDSCPACGKSNIVTDMDSTLLFCPKCGASTPIISKYCTFCGNIVRERNIPDISTTPMGFVYAGPEVLSPKKRKRLGFITKWFKGE